LLGKALDEARIFQITHAYEQSTDWHKEKSPISIADESRLRVSTQKGVIGTKRKVTR
jgi:hypothetical protein